MLRFDRLIFTATLLVAAQSFALVDMKNANFSHSWTDIQLPGGTGYDLKVERTYNSRSLFSGMFGFGWCSDFETTLEKTSSGDIKITECGAGQEMLYKSKQKGKSDVYTSEASDAEFVRAENGAYTRVLPDSSLMKFSSSGKLTHLYDRNGNYLKIDYAKDQITEISDSLGHRFRFEFYPNKKVKRIAEVKNQEAPAKKTKSKVTLLSVDYKYKNMDDLIYVKNAWENTYTYDYDDLHNMVRANYPDKTSIALAYNRKMDWVISFTDREKCVEKYDYQFDSKEPKLHYWAVVKKICGKEQFADNRFEFWYKNRGAGQPPYFAKLLTIENGNKTEIEYHPDFGHPVFIARGKNEAHFEYYPSGQVKKKMTDQFSLTYEYDPKILKVAKVTSVINPLKREPGSKSKAAPITKTASFKYDQRANLIEAENSDGQHVNMDYDRKGRIERLEDQAHKIVKLKYDDRTGKPSNVERPGLGSIKISYKAGGDIDKVVSPEGPIVATQVASIFNNLLDVIAPATAEVFN